MKNLKELSNSELMRLYKEKIVSRQINKNNQLVRKTLANSLYGFTGNQYSRYFDVNIAESITFNGQLTIKWVAQHMDGYLNCVCKTKDKKYVIAGDTDSCDFTTKVLVDGKSFQIGDFYGNITSKSNERGIKEVNCKKALSYSIKNGVEYKDIKYVSKHMINKEMFLIEIDKKSVEITGDHSIVVKRNNKLVSVTVHTIEENDEIIYIENKFL